MPSRRVGRGGRRPDAAARPLRGAARAPLLAVSLLALAGARAAAPGGDAGGPRAEGQAYHVHPGMDIQQVLELAAADPARKTVLVHAGTYRPARKGQALVWFNARHDGITLEAVGEVILTAANSELADPEAGSFPAVVNHVVYFGDGISRRTVLRGFKITGANGYYADADPGAEAIEPNLSALPALREHTFFYSDGGGIKVFGRSYPVIEGVEVSGNYADPCGGGISIEHRGFHDQSVLFRDCIIRDNRAAETGSGADVLPYSAARFENCLFVGNISNTGRIAGTPYSTSYNREHGSGALTVFPGARCSVHRCTFTGNWNGVDDRGQGSEYVDSLFWRNDAAGGNAPAGRYELDVADGTAVRGCFLQGEIPDLRRVLVPGKNTLGGPDPLFDADYRPRAKEYEGVGYRPVRSRPEPEGSGPGPPEGAAGRPDPIAPAPAGADGPGRGRT
jgi:hypothetical protein